jgi:hypothetical protein
MATKKVNIDIIAKDKSKRALNTVRGSLDKLKSSVFNVRNALAGLGAGLVIRNLVNTGKQLENLETRFKFLLKNAEEGAKAFDNMSKFASQVPFSLEEIQSGSGILATVTDNAEELQRMLEITGNVAAVTGLDFRTTAEQIQRSFSAGIGAADLFREKGVRNMLGFQAGATVSIEETVKAFDRVFGKGGEFGRATDELANTFEGTLSMIGDKFFNFKRTILEAGFFPELKKQFKSLDDFLADNTEGFDILAEKIGRGLAIAVRKISDGFILLKDNANLVAGAFAAIVAVKLAGVFTTATFALAGLTKGMKLFNFATKKNIIFASVGVFATTFGLLIEKFREFKKELSDGTFESMKASKSVSELKSEIDSLSGIITDRLGKGFTNEMSLFKHPTDEGTTSIQLLRAEIEKLAEELQFATENMEEFGKATEQPLDKVKQLAMANSKAYADMKDSTGEALVKIEEENKRSFNKTIQDHALFGFTMKQAEKNNQQERANLFTEMMSKRQRVEKKLFQEEKILEQQKFDTFTEMMSKRHRKEQELLRENEEKKVALKKQAEQTIFSNTKSSLQALSGLNRTGFEAFKRFQIAEATINAISGAATAFKTFAGNPFMATFVAASHLAKGMALVAQIKSTNFREKGGAVTQGKPFIVGEKGAELFVPNQSGNIVPNNKLMAGGAVNVTFNINTVDARGFNELLTNSRGTIVSLINSAVNETGRQAVV